MSQYQISLDALFARDVAVQWFEGVALVQTACRQVLASRPDAAGFPSASQILLKNDGTVSIVGSSWAGDSVEGAARMLVDLRTVDVPVQLRLLLTQATGRDGAYPTLSEFSSALAYFERSAPQMILQQLFVRAAAATARDGAPAHATPELAPLEKAAERENAREKKPDAAAERRRKKGGHAGSLGAAAAVLALVGGGIWFVGVGPGRDRVAAAGVTVMQQLGLGTPSAAAETTGLSEPVEKETTPSARRREAKTTRAANGNAAAALAAPAAARTAVSSLTSARPVAAVVRPDGPDLLLRLPDAVATYEIFATPAKMVEAATPLALADFDTRIYSSTDEQVVPPRAIYPRFPATPPETPLTRRTVVEVVVDGNGLVERVRLRTRPKTIHEFMLLSAAKAWRFEPATMNGQPVRFLQNLTLVMQ